MHIFCLRHGSHILSELRCLLYCIVAEKDARRKCENCVLQGDVKVPKEKTKEPFLARMGKTPTSQKARNDSE